MLETRGEGGSNLKLAVSSRLEKRDVLRLVQNHEELRQILDRETRLYEENYS